MSPRLCALAQSLALGLALSAGACARAGAAGALHARDDASSPPEVTTRSLLSLGDIGGAQGVLSVSPNGRLVAFQIQKADFGADTYRSDWYVSPIVRDARPLWVGSGGDLILAAAPFGRLNGARADIRPQWAPDGQWVAYLRRDGDQVQVWRSSVDGRLQEQLTHNAANVVDFIWQPDSRAIYFRVGRSREAMARQDHDEGERGYLLDDRFMPIDSTKPLWLPCGQNLWNVPAVPSQRCVPRIWVVEFGSRAREANPAEIRAYQHLTAPQRPAGAAGSALVRYVTWNRAHTEAAWLATVSSEDKGSTAPLVLFVDGHRCPAASCTGRLQAVWWHGTSVVFLRLEGWAHSVPAVYSWGLGRDAPVLIYRQDSTLSSCDIAAGDRLVCLQETPTDPRKIVSIHLPDGRIDTVFDPNPGFARFRLGRVEKLEVTDGLGNQAFGHLVFPPDFRTGCRYPLVIVQYRSRGFLRGGVGDEYPIYPLAASGFLVYSADSPEDLRLTAHYDTSNLQGLAALAQKEIGPTGYRMRSALRALDAAIDRLQRRGIVDASEIGITGLSAGAEALYFALIHSTRFAAAATSGSPSPDSYSLEVNDAVRGIFESYWDAKTRAEAIHTGDAVLSLAHNITRVNTPLLFQVSDHELISFLPDYVALHDAGKPVEAYVFPDEHHVKSHPLHKLAVGERTIDWFRFWLEGREDPSSDKAAQYARWRVMRGRPGSPSSRADRGLCSRSAAPGARPDLDSNARQEWRQLIGRKRAAVAQTGLELHALH